MPRYPLARAEDPLIADVLMDDKTAAALAPFDLDPDEVTKFHPWVLPEQLPERSTYGIGLIVGASGSGKSQLLAHFGETEQPTWEPRHTLVSHFDSAEDATERFYAVGLNTVPVWRLPYAVLSNGQKFRADLARSLRDGAVIDEFTSVVDRNVARSASRAMRSHVDRVGLTGIVVASCHRDVIPWLRPDWAIDTDAGTFTVGEVAEAPRWYAEHLTGEPVGRLTLKAAEEPVTAPADAEEPETPEDPRTWTAAHTAAATRRKEIETS